MLKFLYSYVGSLPKLDVQGSSLGKCTVVEKGTNESKPCQFPFIYKDQIFHGCTTVLYKTGDTFPWCSTKRKPGDLEHLTGDQNYGNCSDNCLTAEEGQTLFDEKVEKKNILDLRGFDPIIGNISFKTS